MARNKVRVKMSKKENHKQDLARFFDEFLKTGDDGKIIEYLVSNSIGIQT